MPEITITALDAIKGMEDRPDSFLEYRQFLYELACESEVYKLRVTFVEQTPFASIEIFSKADVQWNSLLQVSYSELETRRDNKDVRHYYVDGDEDIMIAIVEKILF